jgi:hypothetical protein
MGVRHLGVARLGVARLGVARANHSITRYYGMTPLLCAAFKGHMDVVVALLAAQADINERDIGGYRLHTITRAHACTQSHDRTLKAPYTLAQSQRNSRRLLRSGATALHWAAHNGHVASAVALISANADLDARNDFGSGPIHAASERGRCQRLHSVAWSGYQSVQLPCASGNSTAVRAHVPVPVVACTYPRISVRTQTRARVYAMFVHTHAHAHWHARACPTRAVTP